MFIPKYQYCGMLKRDYFEESKCNTRRTVLGKQFNNDDTFTETISNSGANWPLTFVYLFIPKETPNYDNSNGFHYCLICETFRSLIVHFHFHNIKIHTWCIAIFFLSIIYPKTRKYKDYNYSLKGFCSPFQWQILYSRIFRTLKSRSH